MEPEQQERKEKNTNGEEMLTESSQKMITSDSEQDCSANTSKSKCGLDFYLTEVTILTEIAPPYSRGIPYLNRQSTNRVISYQFSSEKAIKCCSNIQQA